MKIEIDSQTATALMTPYLEERWPVFREIVSERLLGLEECRALWTLLERHRNRVYRILDIGAGFSTLLFDEFRRPGCLQIVTVEPLEGYGERVRRQLRATDRCHHCEHQWKAALEPMDVHSADLILLDSGPTYAARAADLALILQTKWDHWRTNEHDRPALLIVDDAAEMHLPAASPLRWAVL